MSKDKRVLCVKKYYLYEGIYRQILVNKKGEEFVINERIVGYINTSNPDEYFNGCRFGRTSQYVCYCHPIVLNLDTFNENVFITKELGKLS